MRPNNRSFTMLRRLLAATTVLMLLAGNGHAAQILVSRSVDLIRQGDGCSLREALINANTNSKLGSLDCARGSADETDVIVLPPETFAITSPLDITEDLVILGGSGTWTRLDGRHGTRIIDVQPGVSLTIRGVQLMRGYAVDEGAAIRVQANGHLSAEYLVVQYGNIASGSVGGRGAGVFLAEGVVANISRSEISGNSVQGSGGSGGGIYCAEGCQLTLSQSTVTDNWAGAEGGGLWVAGDATLSFSTVANNKAPEGAGMALGGSLDSFASILADNGEGGIGADLLCTVAAAPVAAKKTFVEMPGETCVEPAGAAPEDLVARKDVPSGLPPAVLLPVLDSPYRSAPSNVHLIEKSFAPFLKAQIPYSDPRCSGIVERDGERNGDQHGRSVTPNTACDLGSVQPAALSVWVMAVSISAAEAGKHLSVFFENPPTAATTLRLRPVTPGGGVGENCSGFVTDVPVVAGQRLAEVFVEPAKVFALPGLNRTSRVCELVVEVAEGSFKGATAGNVRVRIYGDSASTTKLSTPEPGYTLDFATVPVGTGGVRSLVMTPDLTATGAMSVTSVTFKGLDKAAFEIVAPDAAETAAGSGVFVFNTPLVLADRSVGGSAIQIGCKPGRLGDYDAEMIVSTTSPVYQDLTYGVRCSQAHYLSFTVLGSRVVEKGGPVVRAVVSLDSPCLFDSDGLDGDDGDGECLRVDLAEIAGSATSGEDYESFGGPVVFAPNETQKFVDIRIIDDLLVEEIETFGIRATPQNNGASLYMPGDRTGSVVVSDDDMPSREIAAFITGLPANVDPGTALPFTVAVHNRSTAALGGVRVEIALAQPMLLRSFALQGATCSLSLTKRRATCQISSVLAANMKPATAPDGSPLDVLADEADVSRRDDADWIHFYGRLVTADMKQPPVMDVRGNISVSVAAGSPTAVAAVAHTLTIDAPPVGSLGGALGPHWILLLLLLFRQQSGCATGRMAGWFRPRIHL